MTGQVGQVSGMRFVIKPEPAPQERPRNDCGYRWCTGVHDNNRYAELCGRSLDLKRGRDSRYYTTAQGFLARIAKKYGVPVAELGDFLEEARREASQVSGQAREMTTLLTLKGDALSPNPPRRGSLP